MSKRYVACVGRMHSGKDVFCEAVARIVGEENVEFIRFSDPLGACLKRMKAEMPGCADIVEDREHFQNYSTIIREEISESLLAEWVQKKALASGADWPLIMGMRKMLDLPAMRKLPDCTIVAVEAPQGLRLVWSQRTAAKKGLLVPTREEFIALDNQECEVDIDDIMTHADWRIVNDRDDSSLAHIHSQAERFVRMMGS